MFTNLAMVYIKSSSMTLGALDSISITPVNSGKTHAVFVLSPTKLETVSHAVKAGEMWMAFAFWGPSATAIL